MGIGPAFAIPKVLAKSGMADEDVDIYEINEAFASQVSTKIRFPFFQALYSVRKLNIDPEKVNPRGGAIALGHPLGMTGARMIATLINDLKLAKKRHGVVSMCTSRVYTQ